jgi:peptidoglycan/xylan/chitin deacetylase (PgdA/CDA1 family)
MGEAARFIVSLDCEGKWGMADHLQPYHHQLITDEALARAYEQLVGIFGRYEIAATFAFVMAFILNAGEREQFATRLAGDKSDPWLKSYREAVRTGQLNGWHQPLALDLVRTNEAHEIACHGFCHRPLDETSISTADAIAELDAALEVARIKALPLKTFVYPRNRPGHQSLLRARGFIGYRQRLRRPPGVIGRLTSLVEEFNAFAPAQQPARRGDTLVPIPSGRFLNWQFGLRKRVPAAVTLARWRHQLRRACDHGGVVHLWLHPHNLITGPGTAELLDQILTEVAALRNAAKLRVVTQQQYCEEELMRS